MVKISADQWLNALVAALEEAAARIADDGKISLVDACAITARFFKALAGGK